ncbi:MAG TPA: ABC transporter permease subunit [Phycisphaerales bacterium]|mgnify:CR=1 FL=1|jgi:ABC-2 type transport system permease protein|nr:ABC transporter permease subunit [Phycisphaerales bacterium]
MTRLWALTSREFSSFFRTPLGWVVLALFLCLSSVLFVGRTLVPGEAASMRDFFAGWLALLLFIAPAVSMRLFAEELRTGTIEPLLTAPVREGSIVAAKYIAAVLFLITMLIPSAVYVLILDSLSRPDFGPILSGYLGLLLLGMLYLSVGTLVSVLTSSQTLAFLGTLFALLILDVGPRQAAPSLPSPFDEILLQASPSQRIPYFASGLIDTAHVAFFLLASLWFLVLAAVILQSRRWR